MEGWQENRIYALFKQKSNEKLKSQDKSNSNAIKFEKYSKPGTGTWATDYRVEK